MIVPIALFVVFLILVALLRAIVAPLVLIGTVVLSLLRRPRVATFFFENVFDFAGHRPGAAAVRVLFLVALGIDYNIFLMARVREETLTHGTPTGRSAAWR